MIPSSPTRALSWGSPIERLLAVRRRRLVRQLRRRAAWAREARTAPALQAVLDADPSGGDDQLAPAGASSGSSL